MCPCGTGAICVWSQGQRPLGGWCQEYSSAPESGDQSQLWNGLSNCWVVLLAPEINVVAVQCLDPKADGVREKIENSIWLLCLFFFFLFPFVELSDSFQWGRGRGGREGKRFGSRLTREALPKESASPTHAGAYYGRAHLPPDSPPHKLLIPHLRCPGGSSFLCLERFPFSFFGLALGWLILHHLFLLSFFIF